jgi:hypothetical protein
MAERSANDILVSGGEKSEFSGRSLKFTTIGDKWFGVAVAEPQLKQKVKFGTTELEFWDNGDPIMQIVIGIHTDLRSDDIEDDDGVRYLYCPKFGDELQALSDALKAGGSTDGIQAGDKVGKAWTGQVPSKVGNPRKIYSWKYEKGIRAANAAIKDAGETTAEKDAAAVAAKLDW